MALGHFYPLLELWQYKFSKVRPIACEHRDALENYLRLRLRLGFASDGINLLDRISQKSIFKLCQPDFEVLAVHETQGLGNMKADGLVGLSPNGAIKFFDYPFEQYLI